MKILVVEDTEDSRTIFRVMLESFGHEVLEAADGEQALRIALKHRPDFVLMDLRMPALNGLVSTGAMRAIKGLHNVPIVAMTADYSADIRDSALTAGCNDCIAKPITREELGDIIRKYAPDDDEL